MSDKFNPMVADTLGESAGPFVFTFEGQEYKLGYPTQAARAVYEKLLIAHEWELLNKNRENMPADTYASKVDRLMKEVDDGLWASGQPKFIEKGLPNLVGHSASKTLWIKSLFYKHHPDISKETIIRMIDQESALGLGLRVVVPFTDWIIESAIILAKKAGQMEAVAQLEKLRPQIRSIYQKSMEAS